VEPLRYPFRGAQISAALRERFELSIKLHCQVVAADRVLPSQDCIWQHAAVAPAWHPSSLAFFQHDLARSVLRS
jgi:hypothetical protein